MQNLKSMPIDTTYTYYFFYANAKKMPILSRVLFSTGWVSRLSAKSRSLDHLNLPCSLFNGAVTPVPQQALYLVEPTCVIPWAVRSRSAEKRSNFSQYPLWHVKLLPNKDISNYPPLPPEPPMPKACLYRNTLS